MFAALNIWFVNAFSFKVGTYSIDKIVKDSVVGQDLNSQLQKKFNETNAKLTTAKTATEQNQLKSEFEQFKAAKQKEFLDKVNNTIAKVAKRKGIKAVASPQVFVYSELDLTSDIIKELAK